MNYDQNKNNTDADHDRGKNDQQRRMTLKHAERRSRVLDIGNVKDMIDHGDRVPGLHVCSDRDLDHTVKHHHGHDQE